MNKATIGRSPAYIPPIAGPTLCFAVYTLLGVATSPALYLRNLSAFAFQFLPSAFVLGFVGLVGAGLLKQPGAPLSFVAGVIRQRGSGVIATAAALCIGMAAFWTLKYHIPRFVPFYADPALADIDQILHFGDPWRWVHAAIPARWMSLMLIIYFPAWLLLFFGCTALAAFHPSSAIRSRYWMSFAAIYAGLGTALAAIGASVGPIFYDQFFGGHRFAELLSLLKQSEMSTYHFFIADKLYSAYLSGVEDFFAGISAMPSIHVAVATLNALFLSGVNRAAGVLAWVFVLLTMAGSVYFGWHYAVDGYVSFAAVLLFWRLFAARRLVPSSVRDEES
ncbi:phosphatase PAP2 family protein [Pseudaminobacter sp. 19-2017]|uniref:Phosphatase PAP2 family protein n=1 Tax=Pseudaminobacter soli (ex Zhang et al. 2022) TaxID=2831468 RepID=A0A942I2A6_9HYPH|nr:phosphatase PAP2 family protein [Pseudaminobacter soli]MBS3648094.1 phosphatase PAP2 family protein [Pseudaminobacter soli]